MPQNDKHTVVKVKEKIKCPVKPKVDKFTARFFLVILLTLGLNFGFIKFIRKELRSVAKCLYTVTVSIMVAVLGIPLIYNGKYYRYFYLAQYAIHFVMLHYSKYNLCNLIIDVESIDEDIGIVFETNRFGGLMAFAYLFTVFIIKMGACIVTCVMRNTCHVHIIPEYVFGFATFGLDVMTTVQILVGYYIFCSVVFVKESIKKNDLKYTSALYTKVVDCLSKIQPLMSKILIVELLITIPKIMGSLWMILKLAKYDVIPWGEYCRIFVHFSHALSQLCIPAIVAEMTKSKIDSIKLDLRVQLLMGKDEQTKEDIVDLLRYMDSRVLYDKLWSVLPLDLQLPISLLQLIATYFIVIIQFSHMYD